MLYTAKDRPEIIICLNIKMERGLHGYGNPMKRLSVKIRAIRVIRVLFKLNSEIII